MKSTQVQTDSTFDIISKIQSDLFAIDGFVGIGLKYSSANQTKEDFNNLVFLLNEISEKASNLSVELSNHIETL